MFQNELEGVLVINKLKLRGCRNDVKFFRFRMKLQGAAKKEGKKEREGGGVLTVGQWLPVLGLWIESGREGISLIAERIKKRELICVNVRWSLQLNVKTIPDALSALLYLRATKY